MAFPAIAGKAAGTYGGTGGWVVRAEASPRAVALARRLSDLQLQRDLAAMNQDIPTVVVADEAISDPLLRELAGAISATPSHQLYLDQYFGPEVGDLVNRLAVEIVAGDVAPAKASEDVTRAWAAAWSDTGAGAPAPEPAAPPP
jgi:raffinose/stachyose/melibiose transport system substrate-binding protein